MRFKFHSCSSVKKVLSSSLFFFSCLFFAESVKAEGDSSIITVETALLDELIFFPAREAPATAVSLNNSMISAEISGGIAEIMVQTGDEIAKGDVLAKINCESYKIAKQRALAALHANQARQKYANQRLEDVQHLRKSNAISADELNLRSSDASALSAETNILNADIKEASRKISKCIITAPFDAVVIDRTASVGDYASVGSPLVQLLDLNNLEVSAKIQQQDTNSLQQAGEIYFISSSKEYPMSLRTIVPLVDSRIRSFESRLIFTDQIAPSGSAGRLRWASGRPHISPDFLVERSGQLGVFFYQNDIAHFHPLSNVSNGLPAPIDLPSNTAIITTGRYGLVDGQIIKTNKQ